MEVGCLVYIEKNASSPYWSRFFFFMVSCCPDPESSVANCVHQSVLVRLTCPSPQVVILANIIQLFWKGNNIKKALARSLLVLADFDHDNAY